MLKSLKILSNLPILMLMVLLNRTLMKQLSIVLIVSFFVLPLYARNTPCSGSKGGIAYCENGRFRCNDGSYSRSKRTCVSNSSDRLLKPSMDSSSSRVYRWKDNKGVVHFSDSPRM